MSTLLRFAVLAAAMFAPMAGAATSTVYKCAGDAGAVVYQDAPCPPGQELGNLAIEPSSLSVVPGTPVSGTPAKAHPSAATHSEPAASERHKSSSGNAAQRKFIQIGMSAGEVVQRIGRPDIDAKSRRGQGQQWSYLPREGDPNILTTLTLIDGKVADVQRKIVR